MSNKISLLALNRLAGLGPIGIKKLQRRFPDLNELFGLSAQELIALGITSKLAHTLKQDVRHAIEADLSWENAHPTHHILTWDDAHYPSLLKEIHDPPPVLYAIGDITCLTHPCLLAMVGTRKPSATGRDIAWQFAYELAAHHIHIVSGLALGIDAQAHMGSLAAAGSTIAVMATGIDTIYPHTHQKLASEIGEKGVILTEFPLKTSPNPRHFPRRNRIISGLSLATLVVEAAIKSGSLITARFALEQNRDVFAIPGSIHNPQAQGCHHLLQQGAQLITTVQDILEQFSHKQAAYSAWPASTMLDIEQPLMQWIGFETTSFDLILQRSQYAVDELACALTELELEGLIQAVPGGYARSRA